MVHNPNYLGGGGGSSGSGGSGSSMTSNIRSPPAPAPAAATIPAGTATIPKVSTPVPPPPPAAPAPAGSIAPAANEFYTVRNESNLESTENYRLELLHITKTGGTMLEVIALKQNVTWGACHFEFPWKHRQKNKLKDCPDLRNKRTLRNPLNKKDLSLWHYPLSVLDRMNLPFDPYDNLIDGNLRNKTKRFFIVVRNPYSRLLSLFYMAHTCKRSPEEVNEWIQSNIIERGNGRYGNGFTPSSEYIYRRNNVTGEKERVVHHILPFERLKEEFAELMDQYNLPLEIPETKINGGKCPFRLTAHNLTKETINLINMVYAEDFELGGYEIIK
jgi:hypothetical protein